MVERSSRRSDRKILSFPAVHPCEAIAQQTLLRSLISLAHTISSYREQSSSLFVTQRKNAREAIRKVDLLLIFLEEIRDCDSIFSPSVLLCFSELHLTFQKLQFLLEDCGREEARLWMLMKSEFVATQFSVLIRAVATALEVLWPLNSMQVCDDVKDYVELVVKQGRRQKMEIEPAEEWAMRQVELVLNCFDKGIEPDSDFIKRVLDFLKLGTWSDCNEQIGFLEAGLQNSDCEEQEVSFLSSLLGFMNYCRGVIFQELDFDQGERREEESVSNSENGLNCLNPEDFRCPISLELMTDPVTVSTGQTYDRTSIQKWLKAGNLICPKTGERLKNTELLPNTSLRKVIHRFCADRGISVSTSATKTPADITRTVIPGSNSAATAIKLLSRFLSKRLLFGTWEEKSKAAYEIRLLSKSNVFNRNCLIQSGAILPLLSLLITPNPTTQENAISALLKLSKQTGGKRAIVESNGGIQSIVSVLNTGLSLESRQTAAATIFYLSSVKGYRKLIGENSEAIPGLIELIRSGNSCGRKNAVVAMFGLLLHQGNHRTALRNGAVGVLMEVVSSPSEKEEVVADSLAVLASLAETIEGTIEVVRNSGLAATVKALQSMNIRSGKENCVCMLWWLCKNGGGEVVEALARDRSVMGSLYSMTTEGNSSQGRCKAGDLIKVLHRFCETGVSDGLMASAVPCGRPQLRAW